MKNKFYKNICLFIALGMIIIPINANALSKDETVYAKLNSNGSVKNITVSEKLINDEKLDVINDISDLNDIKNVNGKEKIEIKDNNLTIKAKGNDIYYQGTSKKDLPVSINVKYYLNGKEYQANKMIGKKGSIEIVIKYTNNQLNNIKGNSLYTPFVATMVTTLSSKENSNINVTNGKVISNGVNNIIAGISAPGLYESLKLNELKNMDTIKITYDTTNFKLATLYTTLNSKLIDSKDLDFSKLNSIYSKIDELSKGSNSIVEGSLKLSNGIKLYSTKFNEYTDNMENLKNGSATILSNYITINNGINSLYQGMVQLNNGLNGIYNFTNYTVNEVNSLNTNSTKLSTDLTNHINNLLAIYNSMEDGEAKNLLLQEIQAISNDDNSLKKDVINVVTNAKKLNIYVNEGNDQTQNQSLSKIVNNINDSKDSLVTGATNLYNGSNNFLNGLKSLNQSIIKINEYTKLFNDNSKELVNGSIELYNGANTFNESGINKISSYLNNNIKYTTYKIQLLTELANKYNTFTMSNTNSNTKFIIAIN